MYCPPAFAETDLVAVHEIVADARLATLVIATAEGLAATPLPLLFAPEEGDCGALYGHVARANPIWKAPAVGEALAIFAGPDAYVSPSWYATKAETGRVVPTWNYVAVHAHGAVSFFHDAERLRAVVAALTARHERGRAAPWSLEDAPEKFIDAQLRGIVGVRVAVSRFDAKRKMSQNRPAADRAGVRRGLAQSDDPRDRAAAAAMPAED